MNWSQRYANFNEDEQLRNTAEFINSKQHNDKCCSESGCTLHPEHRKVLESFFPYFKDINSPGYEEEESKALKTVPGKLVASILDWADGDRHESLAAGSYPYLKKASELVSGANVPKLYRGVRIYTPEFRDQLFNNSKLHIPTSSWSSNFKYASQYGSPPSGGESVILHKSEGSKALQLSPWAPYDEYVGSSSTHKILDKQKDPSIPGLHHFYLD